MLFSNLDSRSNKNDTPTLGGRNVFINAQKIETNIGVDKYSFSKVFFISAKENGKAQIGFENVGKNSGTLWLDIDGNLKFTNHEGITRVILFSE